MATLVKQWPTGAGNLSVTYDGSGDGTAVFASDINEGIDREMDVTFVDQSRAAQVTRTVKQIGLREPFGLKDGGIFRLKNGGRFGVLKYKEHPEQPDEPEQPTTEYTELEYIEGTGTQRINLGLLSTAQSEIDIEFGFTSTSSNANIFGGRYSSTSRTFALSLVSYNKSLRFDFNGQKTVSTSSTVSLDTTSRFRFVYDGSKATVTNVTTEESTSTSITPSSSFTTYPIYLFCVNQRGSFSSYLKGRIYRCTYTDGTTTVDLIPVLDKDGVACMYDKVSEQYFYNAGTGSFIAGYKQ